MRYRTEPRSFVRELGTGKLKDEVSSSTDTRIERDTSTHELGEAPADGQTYAETVLGLDTGLAPEAVIEDPSRFVVGDSGASV